MKSLYERLNNGVKSKLEKDNSFVSEMIIHELEMTTDSGNLELGTFSLLVGYLEDTPEDCAPDRISLKDVDVYLSKIFKKQ